MTTDTLIVESPADFHVHLRQGSLSKLVTPHVRRGGFDLAYVMVSDVVVTTSPSSAEILAQPDASDHYDRSGTRIQKTTAGNR